jgi:hypothetical protein
LGISAAITGWGFTAARATGEVGMGSPAVVGVDVDDAFGVWRRELYRQTACGPLALRSILSAMGTHLSSGQDADLISAANMVGADFSQLQLLAQKYGYHATGVLTTAQQLREMHGYAIVQLDGYRFVAVTGFTDGGFEIVEPLEDPSIIPVDNFTRSFGERGYALLVSKAPITGIEVPAAPHYEGPHLSLSRNMMAIGLRSTLDWSGQLTITNDGTVPITLGKIIPSCSCMHPHVESPIVEVGKSVELEVMGREASSGPFSRDILLTISQPESKPIRIPVKGIVEPSIILSKPYVVLAADGRHNAVKVPFTVARGTSAETSLHVNVFPEVPIDIRYDRVEQAGNLDVRIKNGAPAGTYRCKVEISDSNAEKSFAQSSLYIVARVEPACTLQPSFLQFAEEEMVDEVHRNLTIFCKKPLNGLRAEWTDPLFEKVFNISTAKKETGIFSVQITAPADKIKLIRGRAAKVQLYDGQDILCQASVQVGDPGW